MYPPLRADTQVGPYNCIYNLYLMDRNSEKNHQSAFPGQTLHD